VFDPGGKQPCERLGVAIGSEKCRCHGSVVVGHVVVIREFDSGEPQRPLGQVIEAGDPDQAKALLRILNAELRVNSRNEILPTYRVGAPVVCAQTSSVEPTDLKSNRFAWLPGGRMSLDDAG
jgi:hypothetical protein